MDTAGNRPQAGEGSPGDGDSPRDGEPLRDGPVPPDIVIVIAPAHPAPHEPTEIVFEVRPREAGAGVRQARLWMAEPLRDHGHGTPAG